MQLSTDQSRVAKPASSAQASAVTPDSVQLVIVWGRGGLG